MICVLCGCADPDGSEKIPFFNLPSDPSVREKWLKVLKLTCMPDGGAVCSNHFEPDNFLVINGKIELEPSAVPIITKTNMNEGKPERKTMKRPASTPLERTEIGSLTTLKVRRLEYVGKRNDKNEKRNYATKSYPSAHKKNNTKSDTQQPNPSTQNQTNSPPTPIPFAIQYPPAPPPASQAPPPASQAPPLVPLSTQYPHMPSSEVMSTIAWPRVVLPSPPKITPVVVPSKNFVPIQVTLSKPPTADPPIIDLTDAEPESVALPQQINQTPIPTLVPISQPQPQQQGPPPTFAMPSGLPQSTAPKIGLKSIGVQTMPSVPENGKHLETRFFVSPRYVSSSPIWHIQAVKIGEKGVTAMPFTSTICRSSQTSVKDLDLPVPDKLLQSLPQETDIGRYIPVTVVVQKGLEDQLQEELAKANKKIEKLKGMIDRKNKQLTSTTAALHRKMKRIECLKDMIIDLKTPSNRPMSETFYTQSEVGENCDEDSEFITSLKVLEYSEAPPVDYESEEERSMPTIDVNSDQLTIIGASQTIEADSSEILTMMESSTADLGNMQACEIAQEALPIVYSTYMPTENVR